MVMCLQKEISMRLRTVMRRHLASDARGQELVEFAFVFPILMMLLIGMFWIGRAISVKQALERAAREGARTALASPCATCGGRAESRREVRAAVDGALSAASLNTANATTQVNWNQPFDPGAQQYYVVSGVTVTVTYPVQLTIPFTAWNGTTINLSSTVSMRQEF